MLSLARRSDLEISRAEDADSADEGAMLPLELNQLLGFDLLGFELLAEPRDGKVGAGERGVLHLSPTARRRICARMFLARSAAAAAASFAGATASSGGCGWISGMRAPPQLA